MPNRVGMVAAVALLAAGCSSGGVAPPASHTTTSGAGPSITVSVAPATITCPCWGCPPQLGLQAGDDTAGALGISGVSRGCGADSGPATSIAWDGFGHCPSGDCAVSVAPGDQMVLTVGPPNPEMNIATRYEAGPGRPASQATATPAGRGRYLVPAPLTPGEHTLVVAVTAPGEEGIYAFHIRVRHPGLEGLEAARALWRSRGLTRYRYTAELGWDWGSAGRYQVWVDTGRTVEVPPPGTAPLPYPRFGDVEWLFDLVGSIPPEYLRDVVFDPKAGYPTMVMGVGPGHEEWMLWVRDLTSTTESLPGVPEAEPSLPWLSRGRIQEVVAVVEGALVDGTAVSFDPPGWVVWLQQETVLAWRDSTPPPGAEPLRVVDPLRPAQLPVLRGAEGRSLVLFLGRAESRAGFRLLWAARRTDRGLEFVGPANAVPFLNAEVPRLCVPVAQRTGASPATLASTNNQLAVLTEWVRRLGAFRDNHGTAATLEQAEERLARVCRDSGMAQ